MEQAKSEIIAAGNRRVLQRQNKRHGWTAARRKTFLDVLASSSNVTLAAHAVGLSARAAYDLRSRDHAFAALWREALAIGYERLEQALLERARLGVNDIEIEGELPILIGNADGKREPNGARLIDGRIEIDVKLAQWLIERHDKSVRGNVGTPSTRPASRDVIEAKIVAKLDALKKQGRYDR